MRAFLRKVKSTPLSSSSIYKPNVTGKTSRFFLKFQCLTGRFLPEEHSLSCKLKITIKPWPNDRKMPTQHIATLLGATCCAQQCCAQQCCDMLRWHVAIVWPGLKTSFSRLRFWFIFISFQNFFLKFEMPNSGCGLSASAAYTPVFTVINPDFKS